jgi:DNA polymerase-3 subunit alpha
LKSEHSSKDNDEIIQKIVDACEDYELAGPPLLPNFVCPNGYSQDEYLTELCRHGWKNKLVPRSKVTTKEAKEIYAERVKHELGVIFKAGLSGYFLIVQDIIKWIKEQGWIAGVGRGSAAGSLVSYLLDITDVDPIEYDLIFERFYNEGRNTEGNISIPDIDMDVPAEHRDEVIAYIKEKYGHDKVSQMITLGRLQGRSALKEVLRVNEAVSFAEMNEITNSVPDESRISDQLELMEEKSIIKWALINQADDLKNWCTLNDDDTLSGPLAHLFEQAINIEGTNKSQGKHAAGVIISRDKLEDVCPMVLDKGGNKIAALEMGALETMGHIKFDVLGVEILSKVMEICNDDYED